MRAASASAGSLAEAPFFVFLRINRDLFHAAIDSSLIAHTIRDWHGKCPHINVIIAFKGDISTPLFWFLDGYYLSLERQYRELYNVVRKKDEADIDFDLNARKYNKGKNSWLPCTFSVTLSVFYGTLIIITLLIMFYIN